MARPRRSATTRAAHLGRLEHKLDQRAAARDEGVDAPGRNVLVVELARQRTKGLCMRQAVWAVAKQQARARAWPMTPRRPQPQGADEEQKAKIKKTKTAARTSQLWYSASSRRQVAEGDFFCQPSSSSISFRYLE